RGSALVKTPSSRSRALLLRMTSADQRRTGAERDDRGALFLRARFFVAMADDPWARAGRFPARRSRKPRAQGWYARGRSRICYWGRPHFIELSTEGCIVENVPGTGNGSRGQESAAVRQTGRAEQRGTRAPARQEGGRAL